MSRPSRIAIVKELGSRSPRCLAAHAARGSDEPELVVVERYPAALGAEVLAMLEDEAKELVTFEQTNVATIIASVKLKGDVAILSEWVDGESLASIFSAEPKPTFEMLLRVLSDVCDAVSALHRQGARVCGALGAEDIFVGVDGVTRITRFGLGKMPPGALGARRLASMSPEFLRGEKSPQGDVFTLGTLAWECFMGAQLFETPKDVDGSAAGGTSRTLVDAQLAKLGENPPRVDPQKREAWAAPLADVIARALSIDKNARYATPAEFSSAISAAAPGKIATRATVSQWVARAFGERIEARLVKLEPKVDVTFGSVSAPPMSIPPAVEAPALTKVPAIEAAPTPKEPQPIAPAPKKDPPKETAKAPEKIAEKIAETPKAKVVVPAEAKKPEAAKPTPTPVRKPMSSSSFRDAPATTEAAKKIVPLPKRAPTDPDSSPSLAAAAKAATSAPKIETTEAATPAKTNGTTLPAVRAEKIVAKAPAPKPEPPPPPSASDLDSDIDLVSVRPPPIAAKKEEKKEELAAKKEEPAKIIIEPPPPAPSPPPKIIVAPAIESEPEIPGPPRAARVSARDSEINVYAKRSAYRGPLLVFIGLLLAAGGFALGRYTAPDAWPPTPTFSATTTAPSATHSEIQTPTQATQPAPTQTAITNASASASAIVRSDTRVAIAPQAAVDAGAREAGVRYDPNGI